MMVARGRLKHQYPHSWRSKKPVIFRNTPQWFIHMDKAIPFIEKVAARPQKPDGHGHNQPSPKSLREASLQSIRETEWVPASGENRIRGMIEAKPDWVVSRQRAWGVPITVFVRKGTNEVLNDPKVNNRIYDAMYAEGADAWFADADGARFLKPDYDPAQFEKINDVLDVWFDSGSTHTYVLEDATHFPGLAGFKRIVDGGQDRVMYLEGSDQHRGWFHSSLIESSGTRGRAPYDVVLTHGFCLDEKGQKMSKSVGNVTAPQDVIKGAGADILRLWVASSDYSDDLRIGKEILKTFSESYRKMRNTLRWMLGTLAHYDAEAGGGRQGHARAGTADAAPSERARWHRPQGLRRVRLQARGGGAVAVHEHGAVGVLLRYSQGRALLRGAVEPQAPGGADLRRAHLPLRHRVAGAHPGIHRGRMLAVALWRHLEEGGGKRSVHLELFPQVPAAWQDEALADKWDKVRRVRSVVTGALEIERAKKTIGSSLEAAPVVHLRDDDLATALAGIDLAEICITSDIKVSREPAPADAFVIPEVRGIAVVSAKAAGTKCARSWRYTTDVGSDPRYPDLSARDAAAVAEIDAMKAAG